MIDNSVVGQYIRRFRKRKGLSQVELAKSLDITSKYLSEIERGIKQPSLRLLERISVELNLNPGELYGDYQKISLFKQPDLMIKLDEIYQDVPKEFHEDILIMNRKMVKLINSESKKN
ncbi:helix-turn-helix domain-containing protein [Bacillus sinesaloumensis]|uniref:helix-turn-helix domain-containing protein n=1 Tax=Litchfieldia sinesaloumensis TaxID=1926280 RepID=UPI0009888070|nr:helix-turn-helix domain-containing protein [Bacillus sinesaloumensis]